MVVDVGRRDAEVALAREELEYRNQKAEERPDGMPWLGPEIAVPDIVNFRIGFFDFETGGLNANYGRLLVLGVADQLGDVRILRGDEGFPPTDDAAFAVSCRNLLESFQILVSWWGKEFDVRYLNARLVIAGHRPLRRPLMHFDLKELSRRELGFASHRLDAVARTLRLPVQKTPLDFTAIDMAMGGNTQGYENLVEHCSHDVLALRAVFARYMDLLKVTDG